MIEGQVQPKEDWVLGTDGDISNQAQAGKEKWARWRGMIGGKKTIVGIELGSSKLRLVEARMNTAPLVLRRVLELDIISNQPENIRRQLRGVIQENAVGIDSGAISLSGPEVIHRVLEMPPMPRTEIQAVVDREVLQESRRGSGPSAYGWRLLSEKRAAHPKKLSVLILMAPKALVESLQELLRWCGFKRFSIISTPLTLLQSLRFFYPLDGGTALAYVGENAGYILFSYAGEWRFCREFPLRDPSFNEITVELNRALHFYRQSFPGESIGRVILSGREELKASIERELDLRVEVFDPLRSLDLSSVSEMGDEKDLSSRASLLGLVSAPLPINLAVSPVPFWLDGQVQKAAAAMAGSALAAFFLFQSLSVSAEVNKARSALNEKRNQASALESLLQKGDDNKAQAGLARELARLAGKWDGRSSSLLPVFQYLSMVVPDEMVFESFSLKPSGAAWEIELKGEMVGADPVKLQAVFSRFYQNLVSSPLMRAVRVSSFSISVAEEKPDLKNVGGKPVSGREIKPRKAVFQLSFVTEVR